MKKILFFFLAFTFAIAARSQDKDYDNFAALQFINANKSIIGLSDDDLRNLRISNTYFSKTSGLRLVYLQQTFKGIPVYNQIQVLAFKNEILVSNAGSRIAEIEKHVNVRNSISSISPESAVLTAIADRNLHITIPTKLISKSADGSKVEFNDMGVAHENITAELIWSPDDNNTVVRLAWQVYIISKATPDYWLVRIDATDKRILGIHNYTVYDHWDKRIVESDNCYNENEKINHNVLMPQEKPKKEFKYTAATKNNREPRLVNNATYRVIPFPAESPRHPGGAPAVISNPWNAAPGNATTLNWHSNGTTDYDFTRGNNVWAKEDRAGNNSTAGLPATSTTSPDPLTFNFTPSFTVPPTQTTPVQNQQFNITNLFYWVNIFHDITYLYGFDEPAGNFQANNQGRGGLGNDWVNGDAQDGSGTNNAVFSSPSDGNPGRMQMFLWSAVPGMVVTSPASIAGSYNAIEGNFSTNNLLQSVGPVTGQVIYYNDDLAGTTHYACGVPANSVSGKIALIDRGFGGSTCTASVPFVIKVKNAQTAGAIAVIVANNVPGDPITMGGTDNTITIPAVMISQSDGAIIAAQLANNVNVTLSAGVQLDGDVDNGIIVHEFGHGISNRLTGGPATSTCLGNAEHMGEGWSDYYSLMLTQDWAISNVNTGFTSPRGIGTYANGEGPNGFGIRSQKYCTDFSVNNLVYAATIPAQVHSRGEIWCTVLWDMTWNIIQQTGVINSSIYNTSAPGGNSIALMLVTEAMKLQPCSPGFITGRNAILQADAVLYNGQYECAIREAFRRRGMGAIASQGSSASVTDQVQDFSFPEVNISAQPQNATVCLGSNTTFAVTASPNTGGNMAYQWEVSTDGGANYNTLNNGGVYSGATTGSLTITGAGASLNNNRYRCLIKGKCAPDITSSAAILTVGSASSITQQPTNTSVCAPGNTSFTVVSSGSSPVFQWQVSTDGGTNYSDISNGGVYTGATSATLNITGANASFNNYRYKAVISSPSCAAPINSNEAILTVNSPVTIDAQVQNASICIGSNHTFSITASGTGASYQWQVNTGGGFNDLSNGGFYSGVTSASLTITGSTSGLSGNLYRCVVNGTCPASAISNAATFLVGGPAGVATSPSDSTICESGNASFSATASGSGLTFQWQVSTDGGSSFSDVTNGLIYSGVTSATLSLSNITAGMNDYQYRVIISSTICPSPVNSGAAILTVNARPTVTLAAAPYTRLFPGLTTTMNASIVPSSSGFMISWYQNNTLLSGVTGTSYTADINKLGTYRVEIVNRATGCNNQSNLLPISDSVSSRLFIFPSPNNGQFSVSYYNSGGASSNRTVTVYDTKGSRVYYSRFLIAGPYTLHNINLGAAERGIYYVVVGDAAGKKIIQGKVLVH